MERKVPAQGRMDLLALPRLVWSFCFWHPHPMSPGEPHLHSVQGRALKEAWEGLWAQASGVSGLLKGQQRWVVGDSSGSPRASG